ncbi:TPA: cytolethal distending toxin subunit B family protein [Salmonella enterica subsp. diarizonae serovar 61:l,v:z35]
MKKNILSLINSWMKLFCVFFLFSSINSFAALNDFTVVTWNMQGANSGTENKWQSSVRQLISSRVGGADILLLQEAGQVPVSAELTSRIIVSQVPGVPVEEFIWSLGTRSRPQQVFLYFSRVDTGANRVNLAIVSRQRADEVLVVAPPTPVSRPILGIRIGQDAFFNTHALASRGSDSASIIASVNQFLFQQATPLRDVNWMIAGDFNRSPESLTTLMQRTQPAINFSVVSTGLPTQSSGGELDYAVIGSLSQPVAQNLTASPFLAQRLGQITSDHIPVEFSSNR